MKLRIISMIWNKGSKKQAHRAKQKDNPKKQGQYKQLLGQLQEVQYSHRRGARRRRETARNWTFEKIVKENFPNLEKEIDMQVHEAQSVPNKMDARRPTPRHITIKMSKG